MGRAILHSGGPFAWKQIGARYRMHCAPDELAAICNGLAGTPLAIAVRWHHLDLDRSTVLGLPLEALPGTVGVLIAESSLSGWQRALTELAKSQHRSRLHGLFLGPDSTFLAQVALVARGESARLLVYGPVALSALKQLQEAVLKDEGGKLNAEWLAELSEKHANRTFRQDAVLICEHLMARGF
jgi:hypothetical protein